MHRNPSLYAAESLQELYAAEYFNPALHNKTVLSFIWIILPIGIPIQPTPINEDPCISGSGSATLDETFDLCIRHKKGKVGTCT